jgi:hypothetical protein
LSDEYQIGSGVNRQSVHHSLAECKFAQHSRSSCSEYSLNSAHAQIGLRLVSIGKLLATRGVWVIKGKANYERGHGQTTGSSASGIGSGDISSASGSGMGISGSGSGIGATSDLESGSGIGQYLVTITYTPWLLKTTVHTCGALAQLSIVSSPERVWW